MDIDYLKSAVPCSPAFLLDQGCVIKTLNKLDRLRRESGCKVLYSIKSLPFTSVLQWVKPQVDGFSVSSLFEARLADEILAGTGSLHLTTPGLRSEEMDRLGRLCSHISFNSTSQYTRLSSLNGRQYSAGIRINPKLSFLQDIRFDPCRIHSKLGVDIEEFNQADLLDDVQGLHFHTLFSSRSFDPLIETVKAIQSELQGGFESIEWLNLGGGYLFNEMDDEQQFIDLIKTLKTTYRLEVFIEPGNAIIGPAGFLMATVIDLFSSDGKLIAILDTSVNHLPEVFEYQRKPELMEEDSSGSTTAILAGNTCLAGDIFGEYRFQVAPAVGDRLVFRHVGAYSMIKANRFNGVNFPDFFSFDGHSLSHLKHFRYQDYRAQWTAEHQ